VAVPPVAELFWNAAFVFGSLGDPRGFEVIAAVLSDRYDRSEGQGVSCAIRGDGKSCWSVRLQIAADHYYAVHLLGELKDPRAVPILVSYLDDPDVNYKIPWALGKIGGKSVIEGLIGALRHPSPQVRVFAIEGLEDLQAAEGLTELLPLLSDQASGSYDRAGYVKEGITVSEAARHAIAALQHLPNPAR
jgi:HEAT repeat protein